MDTDSNGSRICASNELCSMGRVNIIIVSIYITLVNKT